MSGYSQITHEAGKFSEWITPNRRDYKLACCSCCLVHDMEFIALDRSGKRLLASKVQIKFRLRRNNRATAAMRRGKEFQT